MHNEKEIERQRDEHTRHVNAMISIMPYSKEKTLPKFEINKAALWIMK